MRVRLLHAQIHVTNTYIGHKRIDVPTIKTSGAGAISIKQVRLNCLRLIKSVEAGEPVYVRSLSLHKKVVPWD